jgi:hypothetical protein
MLQIVLRPQSKGPVLLRKGGQEREESAKKEGRKKKNFTQVTLLNFHDTLARYALLFLLHRQLQHPEVNNFPRVTARKLRRPEFNLLYLTCWHKPISTTAGPDSSQSQHLLTQGAEPKPWE